MLKLKLNTVVIATFIIFLFGCNTQKEQSASEIEQVNVEALKLQQQNVLGYWQADNNNDFAIEFFASTLLAPRYLIEDDSIQTGRFYRQGQLGGRFYWQAQSNGNIELIIVDAACFLTPINQCQTASTAQITVDGSDIDNASWSIAFDNNLDDIVDDEVIENLSRAHIDASQLSTGEHFLQLSENGYFDVPVRVFIDNNNIAIDLDQFETRITQTASLSTNEQGQIAFGGEESLAVQRTVEVFVEDQGFQDLVLNEWYENVLLSKSIDNAYTLAYDIHRQLVLPNGVTKGMVQSSHIEGVSHHTISGNLVSQFVAGFSVSALESFNTEIKHSVLNEINFTSDTHGNIARIGLANNDAGLSYEFRWTQHDDGMLELVFDNAGQVIHNEKYDQVSDITNIRIKFIQPINGGYQALFIVNYLNEGLQYEIHDVVPQTEAIDTSTILPGRFLVESSDGYSEITANFTDQNTVEFQGSANTLAVEGFWFVDTNGDVVSFECNDLAGAEITDYATCLEAMDHIFDGNRTISFGHIRRMRFMHQDGNNFQVKYNAIFWGGVFGEFDTIASANWTYRFLRVGDWINENNSF